MNTGIIIHSHTGNTLSVAERLEASFLERGHSVTLERITADNEEPSAAANIKLKNAPDIFGYDLLIFAGPVQAFSVSPVLKRYLADLNSLDKRNVALFVTQYFPHAWMGGNRAMKQMKLICESKGAVILKTGIINWTNKRREQQITKLVNCFNDISV